MRVKVVILNKDLGVNVPIVYFNCDTYTMDKDMENCIDLREEVKGSYRNTQYCFQRFMGSIYVEGEMAVYYREDYDTEWKIIMDRR